MWVGRHKFLLSKLQRAKCSFGRPVFWGRCKVGSSRCFLLLFFGTGLVPQLDFWFPEGIDVNFQTSSCVFVEFGSRTCQLEDSFGGIIDSE